jgi:hypothetical protein
MSKITPAARLLHLRVLALQNVHTAYEPHQDAIATLGGFPVRRLVHNEAWINGLVRHYQRQISPELRVVKP